MNLPDGITLGEARDWLRERVRDGAHCPVCQQHAKVYHRKLNSGMARSLIAMYRLAGVNRWVNITKHLPSRNREEGKLEWWGLVERDPDRRGVWRVTDSGENFVLGKSRIPHAAEVYDGRVLRFDTSVSVTIRDALGDGFDYDELMSTPGTVVPGLGE